MARPELPATDDTLKIELVFSPAPRQIRHWALALPMGSSVVEALAAGRVFSEFPELLAIRLRVGIWGRKAGLDQLLVNHDRIEIYRPLRVDPKVARRERFDCQGVRTAGLFIAKRPRLKAGY